VVLKVGNSDRSFRKALEQNRALRADIAAALKTAGIPPDRIRMARFTSTPTQGRFSSKVKSYEVESRVTVDATSEQEVEAVAAIVDDEDGVSLLSLTFRNSDKEKLVTDVLQKALARVNALKAAYETELRVTLVPRTVGTRPMPDSAVAPGGRAYSGKNVLSIGSALNNPELSVVLHALEQVEPDISQFDQVLYRAVVPVTFDVIPAPGSP
jgi:uncharacterized protein YggE